MARRRKITLLLLCLLALAPVIVVAVFLPRSLARVDSTTLRGVRTFACIYADQPTKFIVTINAENKFYHGQMIQGGKKHRLLVLRSGTGEFRTIPVTKPWLRYMLHEDIAGESVVTLYRNRDYSHYCTALFTHDPA